MDDWMSEGQIERRSDRSVAEKWAWEGVEIMEAAPPGIRQRKPQGGWAARWARLDKRMEARWESWMFGRHDELIEALGELSERMARQGIWEVSAEQAQLDLERLEKPIQESSIRAVAKVSKARLARMRERLDQGEPDAERWRSQLAAARKLALIAGYRELRASNGVAWGIFEIEAWACWRQWPWGAMSEKLSAPMRETMRSQLRQSFLKSEPPESIQTRGQALEWLSLQWTKDLGGQGAGELKNFWASLLAQEEREALERVQESESMEKRSSRQSDQRSAPRKESRRI